MVFRSEGRRRSVKSMLKNVEECSRMYIVEYSSSMQMLRSTPPPLPAASVLHTFNDNSCTHSVSLKGGERFFLGGADFGT